MNPKKIFTRSILLLGFVSLFTDISSEMLYPVMPVYLKSIGYSAIWIGILEGIAEATAGLSKVYFGKLSDASGRRMPFVQLGYFMSSVSKPLLILFVHPIWILACRVTDRLGKGIRTGARDAVLSDECEPENRGKVFGFHRAMDTVGAALGPICALAWLWFHPGDYKTLFLAAVIPALIGVGCAFFVKEKKTDAPPVLKKEKGLFLFLFYWKQSGPEFKKLAGGLIFFALFNSSDMFLLLMAKQHGLSDQQMILAYVFYNLVYACFSLPMGMLADKFGMKLSLCVGFFFFGITYVGMALTHDVVVIFLLFFVYGLYAAATEGISKAWASKLVPKTETATAIGFIAGTTSVAMLVASSLTGLAWVTAGATTALLISAGAAFLSFLYFCFRQTEKR
jgi:MFS family permease